MKAHMAQGHLVGVYVESGLTHTVTTTAANVADVTEVAELLHGKEKTVHADADYIVAQKQRQSVAVSVVHRGQTRQRQSDA